MLSPLTRVVVPAHQGCCPRSPGLLSRLTWVVPAHPGCCPGSPGLLYRLTRIVVPAHQGCCLGSPGLFSAHQGCCPSSPGLLSRLTRVVVPAHQGCCLGSPGLLSRPLNDVVHAELPTLPPLVACTFEVQIQALHACFAALFSTFYCSRQHALLSERFAMRC